MKTIINRSYVIFALVAAFFVMLVILGARFFINGASWATKSLNNHIFTSGVLTTGGAVSDSKGIALVSTVNGVRTYNSDYYTRVSTLHAVGDKTGIISGGAQSLYRSSLVGYDKVNGLYNAVNGKNGGVTLTINSAVNSAAYRALNGAKGAVMVYNYKTGQVPCMVSAPTFDPANPPSSETLNNDSRYEGVYINRCTNGIFTPGSTMKIITTISALENIPDIESRTWNCTGSLRVGDDLVKCSGVHGQQNLEKGLNNSCNCVFASIAIELGSKKLNATMKELGLKKKLTVGRIKGSKSSYSFKDAMKSDIGWAGVGQYNTLVTPLHMLSIAGTIANGGTYIRPYFVAEASGVHGEAGVNGSKDISITPEIAAKLDKLLRSNVVNKYGDGTFPNLQMTGKTGSAERGSQNGYTLRHCWYVGYSQRSDFPYAVVVIVENLTYGSGYSVAAPIANKVLQELLKQG